MPAAPGGLAGRGGGGTVRAPVARVRCPALEPPHRADGGRFPRRRWVRAREGIGPFLLAIARCWSCCSLSAQSCEPLAQGCLRGSIPCPTRALCTKNPDMGRVPTRPIGPYLSPIMDNKRRGSVDFERKSLGSVVQSGPFTLARWDSQGGRPPLQPVSPGYPSLLPPVTT